MGASGALIFTSDLQTGSISDKEVTVIWDSPCVGGMR